MKHTKFSSIIVILIICTVIFTACTTNNSASDNNNNNNNNAKDHSEQMQNEPQKESAEKFTIFLMSFAEGYEGGKIDGFEPASNYGLFTQYTTKKFDALKDTSKTNPFNPSDTLKYQKSRITTSASSGEQGSYYNVYDVYRSNTATVEYLHGTDMVCFYSSYESHSDTPIPDVYSEEKAKSVANEFLLGFMSETELEEYVVESVSFSQIFMCSVHYVRYIGDYRTDDTISVFIDRRGFVDSFNGLNMKKYDKISDTFTVEDLDTANEILTKKLTEKCLKNIKIQPSSVITDIHGKVYLRIDFSYETEIGRIGETAYINVN